MKARLLIVDDEEQFVEALSERLSMRDYDVTTALTGEDAINKITSYNFDVVILDVRLPGVDGTEVLRTIKNLKPLTEVIMLTGHGTVEMAIQGMKLGAFDFLMKPCETEDLTVKIDKAHDRKAEQEDRIRTAKISHSASSPRSVLNDV
ncbi:MAG: response regulator [Deltaproteobacteria bacterium]|jgi:DNA-binding NtrC family response regulator|nr:response regulator [Deltaproteobacteria bacterium]